MALDGSPQGSTEIGPTLDQLASAADVQSNCMFQLAIMLARIAVEPCSDVYKDATTQAMRRLVDTIRVTKEKTTVRPMLRVEA